MAIVRGLQSELSLVAYSSQTCERPEYEPISERATQKLLRQLGVGL